MSLRLSLVCHRCYYDTRPVRHISEFENRKLGSPATRILFESFDLDQSKDFMTLRVHVSVTRDGNVAVFSSGLNGGDVVYLVCKQKTNSLTVKNLIVKCIVFLVLWRCIDFRYRFL